MMNYRFQVCTDINDQEQYMTFLLENDVQINIPYPFLLTLDLFSNPVMIEEEYFMSLDQNDEVIGVWSYIYGTVEEYYSNPEIIQIQSVFLDPYYRKTRMFIDGLQHLVNYIDRSGRGVKEVRFWILANDELSRLCSKIAQRTSFVTTSQGQIEEYRVPFLQLYIYTMGLRSKQRSIHSRSPNC